MPLTFDQRTSLLPRVARYDAPCTGFSAVLDEIASADFGDDLDDLIEDDDEVGAVVPDDEPAETDEEPDDELDANDPDLADDLDDDLDDDWEDDLDDDEEDDEDEDEDEE